MLIGTKNCGYEIIKEINICEYTYVLAKREFSYGTEYVTWFYYNDSFNHGHYTNSYLQALKTLYERAKTEIEIKLISINHTIKGDK